MGKRKTKFVFRYDRLRDVEVTVKKLCKPGQLFTKNGDCLQNSSVGKFETSGPQNSKCGKLGLRLVSITDWDLYSLRVFSV